jgi:hypothetical protein
MSARKKTGEELFREVAARLEARSECKVNDKLRVKTYFYPMPDGSVKFSLYRTALTEDGISFHANGFLTPQEVERYQKKHPEWFSPEPQRHVSE